MGFAGQINSSVCQCRPSRSASGGGKTEAFQLKGTCIHTNRILEISVHCSTIFISGAKYFVVILLMTDVHLPSVFVYNFRVNLFYK